MKKAVMYGAGNIGRGFIGKVFAESGYEVCFIDVVETVVEQLNRYRSYPVRVVSNDGQTEETVQGVRAVNGLDTEAVAKEIAEVDIMATAVGVNVLPKIVMPLCKGLKQRFDGDGKPFNIIICENMLDADKYMRVLIENQMGQVYKEALDNRLGLVEASIGRMVPVMTDEMREGNALRVWVEPYCEMPVDKVAFVGEIPDLKGLVPFSPFGYYIKRKLFIHNMGHAICAYLGWQKGYNYIYECISDTDIRVVVAAAMEESAMALIREYDMPLEELQRHIKELIARFENKSLGDTVVRVGRDPLRKLGRDDRLFGAALYCEKQGVEPNNILKGIIAALQFDNTEDEAAVRMRLMIHEQGVSGLLKAHCGLDETTRLLVKGALNSFT